MVITVGDRLPKARFMIMTASGPEPKMTDEIFAGKTSALFAVPGAFTPTCHRNHLPGFVENAEAFLAKGVDQIVCTSTDGVFVLAAWANATGAAGKISFISDGNGDFARALGLDLDGSANNTGIRSRRYAMLVEDGVVKALNIEDSPGKAEISSASALLAGM